MRIVQAVGWYFPDSLGGTEVYVSTLAQRLVRDGHEVVVAAPEPDGTHEREYLHDGVKVYRYPTAGKVTRAQARGRDVVAGAERFHAWLHAYRPDVVHFHTFVTGLSLREVAASRECGARVIVTSHAASLGFLCERGTLVREDHQLCDGAVSSSVCATCALKMRGLPGAVAAMAGHLPHPLSALALTSPGRLGTVLGMPALVAQNRRAQRELFSIIDHFVVLSEWAAFALKASGAPAEKVRVNRLGVKASPVRARRHVTASPIVFGFVGRAEPIKGLEDAVRAVVSLSPDENVILRAVVIATSAGDRKLLDHCKRLAAMDTRVRFEPAVQPHEVAQLLASIDVLLCPSRVVEGGPTIALEARSVGTPVIGSRLPALTEIVRDGVDGLLHEPANATSLAACLREVTAHPAVTLDAWRRRLTLPRTCDDVADEYIALYRAA